MVEAEAKTPIPEAIVDKLEKLSAATEIDMPQLVKEMKEFIDSDPAIQAMTNKEHQINFACTMLIRRYSMTGGAKQMYLRPFSKLRARLTVSQGQKKYVGVIAGSVQLIERDKDGKTKVGKLQYGAGTLWEKAADKMRLLSPDKVYKTALRAIEKPQGLELGGNDASFVEVDYPMPTKEEYYKEYIEPRIPDLLTSLDDLKLNDRDNEADIRIVKGIVMDSGSGTSAKMGEFGRYAITDDSMIGKGDFVMWVHPDEVDWTISTELYFIGTPNVDNSDPENPIVRYDCHFVVVVPGTKPIKREEEPTPMQKESEEVSLDEISGDLGEEQPPEEVTPEATKEEVKAEPTEEVKPTAEVKEPPREVVTIEAKDVAVIKIPPVEPEKKEESKESKEPETKSKKTEFAI